MKTWLIKAKISAAALALGGCVPANPNTNDTQVNTRVRSPDGTLEAIYAEDIGGGPAVGVTEEVFITKVGAFPRLEERVLSEECIHNVVVKWETPNTVRINYDIASDVHEDPVLHKPSILSIFSSGYWTFDHPHRTHVHFVRRLTPSEAGC